MSIYKRAVELGLTIDNHESDLYLKSCPEADALAESEPNSQMFQFNGEFWWDIPFKYDPWWEQKNRDARVTPT
tara:strand:- start:6376 stop:6594 length:219 start_codon:yes stop_codon:yes gene_type:complete